MAALAAVPSASVAIVVARSAALGIPNGIAVSAGIVLGDLVFIALAVSGLSVVAEQMGSLFVLVKFLGGLYLLWFGFSLMINSDIDKFTAGAISNKQSLGASFLAGFAITLGDIKAIVFYASLLPAFIDMSALRTSDVVIMVLVTVFSVSGVKCIYAVYARKLATYARRVNMEKLARKAAGGVMVGAGGYLILKA